MKKIISLIGLSVLLASCNSDANVVSYKVIFKPVSIIPDIEVH